MRFRDPAEKHLQGDAPAFRALATAEQVASKQAAAPKQVASPRESMPPSQPQPASPQGSQVVFYAALAIMLLALAGLIWVLSS
jgi:hypothetical protein